MNEVKWAIITGADGGMGTEITRAVEKELLIAINENKIIV